MAQPTTLPFALRVYPQPHDKLKGLRRDRKQTVPPTPDAWLVLDAETRTDASQKLTFGSYRFIQQGQCLEEGLFYADDLPEVDIGVLKRYVRTHAADTSSRGVPELLLLSRQELLRKFYHVAYRGRCLVIGFNLPFDLSRLAIAAGPARKRFAGGFSFTMWQYRDDAGEMRETHYRPRIDVKHIDSKRALTGFTSHVKIDAVDRIPEGSTTGRPVKKYVFSGHFLDLKTLAFALTDRAHSLASACETFGVEGQNRAWSAEIHPGFNDGANAPQSPVA